MNQNQHPLDPYVTDIDPVAFALSRVRTLLAWIEEHRASFEAARASAPETAESELRYLTDSTRQAREYLERLTELLMARRGIDPSMRLPRDLARWSDASRRIDESA